MTVKYRVKTKHTKELLKEFVKFSFRVNHPKTTLRLFVIGVGFLIIGIGMERGSLAMWMCLVIGILLCIFAFARHHIGVMQLKGNDEIYQNDWEVDTSFLDGEIRIKNSGETKGFSKSYKEVAALYMDENNYYIGIEGDNLYPLPRKCFVEGKQEEFEKPCYRVPYGKPRRKPIWISQICLYSVQQTTSSRTDILSPFR